ncbi:helix-turn-helix domain-containing protein [Chitinophaga nivalis]|uniref:AraC family transcriptional regulator n=1 Tax=Chitinophaga nivalis TaxID=2991709 RepID=A0ABT3IN59_9BACT|nr:AraC family transcriptional regulator [Chitinophaga nivalis]MCW3464918.1 AraC family transcriptional regulator [Chitinophaga nivalis]MCW3485390.1 AraC family transcriptional regulator [Chitinophaga nivalis]
MQICFTGIVALLAMIISQSVFAAGLLFFAKYNKLSNRLLATLILSIALGLTDHFMRIAGIYDQRPALYFMPIFYSFGFGPLLYFYVRCLVNQDFKFRRIHLLHFIPVALQFVLYLILAFCTLSFKEWYWENVHQPYSYRIEFDGSWISLSIYLFMSVRLLLRYQRWLQNNFSELSKIKLNWLKTLLIILMILCSQWFIEMLLRDWKGLYFDYDYSVEILGITALVLGVAGIRQSNLTGITYEVADKQAAEDAKTLFEPDPEILNKIREAMEKQQLYLNPGLTLIELAQAIKLNPKVVSRHINAGFKKSFNDFVNGYRVEEVKRKLTPANLERTTIMSIAMDAGFNSKSTFNRIFKELTGMAPSEFNS